MTRSGAEVLARFERLPDKQKRAVAVEVLRRVALLPCPPLDDEQLSLLADDRFAELDREEADAKRS
jgi:hypothetical protein